MFIVSKLLNKPLENVGSKIGVDSVLAVSFLVQLVSYATTFGVIDKMNKEALF